MYRENGITYRPSEYGNIYNKNQPLFLISSKDIYDYKFQVYRHFDSHRNVISNICVWS